MGDLLPHVRQGVLQQGELDERELRPRGPLIGFEPTSARVHIVKTCLSIFTDKAWFEKHELGDGRQAIKQYAAWYWQEHLAAIDPAAVTPDEKREIGSRVYKMLTDESVILD